VNEVRETIIGVALLLTVLTILCAQSVVAEVYTWTDKPQYNLGENGKLIISMLNDYDESISIYNITILYPWHIYDANEGKWVGNVTIEGDGSILYTMTEKGTDDDHYYLEVEFTVPTDGTALLGDEISYFIWTEKQQISDDVDLVVASTSWPMAIVGLDMWMTSLIAAVVVCTIILAIVIFLATRGARTSIPIVPASPRAKAK
jgi:hypothetical protein